MRKTVLLLPSFDSWADDADGAFGDAEDAGYLVVGTYSSSWRMRKATCFWRIYAKVANAHPQEEYHVFEVYKKQIRQFEIQRLSGITVQKYCFFLNFQKIICFFICNSNDFSTFAH